MKLTQQIQGVGVGLRAKHVDHILGHRPDLDWFEILADNYLQPNSGANDYLLSVREHYPVTLHSVGMSLGAPEPLNKEYFQRYRQLIEQVQPMVVSDHLCWISNEQEYLHELLPLPNTAEVVAHVVPRISQAQDWLGCQIAIENVSTYLEFANTELTDWELINSIASQADCKILLDINNLHVNAYNHGQDPKAFIDQIDASRISYVHLAGFEDFGTHLLDTHGASVFTEVWQLYEYALQVLGPLPTLIEWDNNLPEFEGLYTEAQTARSIMEKING